MYKTNESVKERLRAVLSVAVIILLAAFCGVVLFIYVDISDGYIEKYALAIKSVGTGLLAVTASIAVVFSLKDKNFVPRLVLTVLVFAAIVLSALYALKISGFREKVSSIEKLRAYISGFGAYAVIITLIMQILQVVVLPIPGFVAVGATVALFGAFYGALISFAGIFIGSLTAFFIGRVLGYRAACWLVGKDALDKWLSSVKGKDKVVLTLMFLLPFFPDDVLCFVAGLSSMTNVYFVVMIVVTRLISVFTTAYSIDGSIIPYDTWWGILIWAALIILTGLISYLVYKNGERIENFFKTKFKKNKDKKDT